MSISPPPSTPGRLPAVSTSPSRGEVSWFGRPPIPSPLRGGGLGRGGLAAALLVLMPFLAACGFQPIYGGSAPSGVRADLAAVEVALIEDRVGQQLRNELVRRFHPEGRPRNPAYRLQVDLRIAKRDLALQKTEIATRANLRITASYTLLKNMDGEKLIQGTTRITTSYDILKSDFATLAAEADARRRGVRELADEITSRLAAFLRYSMRG